MLSLYTLEDALNAALGGMHAVVEIGVAAAAALWIVRAEHRNRVLGGQAAQVGFGIDNDVVLIRGRQPRCR